MANDRQDPRYDYGGYRARGEFEAALGGVNSAVDAFRKAYSVASAAKDRREARRLARAAQFPSEAAVAAEGYGPSVSGSLGAGGGSRRRSSGSAAGVAYPVTLAEAAEAQSLQREADIASTREALREAERGREDLQRAVGLFDAKLETPETVRRNELAALLEAPPVEEFDLLEAALSGKLGWDRLPETREITPEYIQARRNDSARLEEALTGKLGWSNLPETREITPEYVASILDGSDAVAVREPEAAPPMPSDAPREAVAAPLDRAVEEVVARSEQVDLSTTQASPGEAADPREDAPRGVLAQVEDSLGDKKKEIAALYKKLDELDASSAGYINPFQRFGRDVGYTPSLRAVAEGVLKAQNGDFNLINLIAGRPVRADELPSLYAEYREFVSGAEKKASEIGEERRKAAIEERATAASKQQQQQAGVVADELVRYGWKPEHAKAVAAGVVSAYSDPDDVAKFMERARKYTEAQQKRAADEAKARKTRGSGAGGGKGLGDQRLWMRKEKLSDNWRDALKKLADIRSLGNERDIAMAESAVANAFEVYTEALLAWRRSAGISDPVDVDKILSGFRLGFDRRATGGRHSGFSPREVIEGSSDREASIGEYKAAVIKDLDRMGITGADAEAYADMLVSELVGSGAPVDTPTEFVPPLSPEAESTLGAAGVEDYNRHRAAYMPVIADKRREIESAVSGLRISLAQAQTDNDFSAQKDIASKLDGYIRELETLQAQYKELSSLIGSPISGQNWSANAKDLRSKMESFDALQRAHGYASARALPK
tara:strand:- start:14939 stop:17275 length:2337 start_codon:yes stop_codon:yes gene_type:complete